MFGAAAPADSAPATDSTEGYWVAVSGVDLNAGTTYTIDEIVARASAAGGSVSGVPATVKSRTGAPGATVRPLDVAGGYVLYNPGYKRSNYIYDSDWADAQQLRCNNAGCDVTDKWQTQVHEYVQGGPSKSWILTLNARRVSGSGSVYFDYWYACAINVSFAPDHYCETGNGADPSPDSGPMNPGDQLHKYFERNDYSNVEYPMVGIGVHFSNSSTTNRHRGADVCVTQSGASLCAETGNGTGGTHRW